MDAGVVGARIASSVVAPLVKKLFVADGAGAGLVEAPVRISGIVSFTGEKRTLTERDLEKLAAELVRRAVRDIGPHEAPSPGETERAVQRLALTLHALGDIGLSDVEAVHLGHTDFARALHARPPEPPAPPHLDPAPSESALYHRVLDTACLHILHFFTQRSTFVARTLVEQSRRLGELITLVDVLIERIPSQSARDAEFEQQLRALHRQQARQADHLRHRPPAGQASGRWTPPTSAWRRPRPSSGPAPTTPPGRPPPNRSPSTRRFPAIAGSCCAASRAPARRHCAVARRHHGAPGRADRAARTPDRPGPLRPAAAQPHPWRGRTARARPSSSRPSAAR